MLIAEFQSGLLGKGFGPRTPIRRTPFQPIMRRLCRSSFGLSIKELLPMLAAVKGSTVLTIDNDWSVLEALSAIPARSGALRALNSSSAFFKRQKHCRGDRQNSPATTGNIRCQRMLRPRNPALRNCNARRQLGAGTWLGDWDFVIQPQSHRKSHRGKRESCRRHNHRRASRNAPDR